MALFSVNGEKGNPYGLTQLNPGDRVVMDAAGGGGYGDPFDRDPEAVAQDVREGHVTLDHAREDYGVALDPETLEVDLEATMALRNR